MSKFEWTDNLNLNIDVIDKQHKMFLVMVNVLYDAMEDGKSREIQSDLIDKLIDYALSHFTKEEEYLDISKFPDTVQHKNEHKSFVDKIIKFKHDHEYGNKAVSVEIIEFMSKWWINHITLSDRKYLPFVTKHV